MENKEKTNTTIRPNLIQKSLIFVPAGKKDIFYDEYFENEAYKSKIIFVEDTHEILVNGKSYGYNYDQIIDDLGSELWTAYHENENDIVDIRQNIITINANINDVNIALHNINTLLQNESSVRDLKDTQIQNNVTSIQSEQQITNTNINSAINNINILLNKINSNITSLTQRVRKVEQRLGI